MQSPAPTGTGSSSQIALSPVERSAFAYLFQLADPQHTGLVTGDAAVAFFAKSKLPPQILGPIWAMADSDNNGFLTAPSFSKALRLIGHAQRGEPVTEALVNRPGIPPTLDGITLPLSSQVTGSQPTPALNRPGVIEIKPEDRARYTRIFANSGPVGGLIDGDKAKEIFVKSKLPFDKLGAIWNLADTQARGTLDLTDFIIAMHFIQNIMNGTLNSIPAALPPGLYEQAKGAPAGSGGSSSRILPGSPLAAQNTGGSASGFSAIPRQMTGSGFPSTPTRAPQFAPSATPWDVTSEEKFKSDQFFDGLDTSKSGKLDGATVVPFFMQSKLAEAVLAHIWDLSDVTQSGTLTKDEFAVAMHLISAQISGKPLPQELPANLVPPSMRNMNLPKAVDPQQSDTQRDLFSLMDDDVPPPAATVAPSAFIAPTPAPTASKSVPGPFDDDFFGGPAPSAQTPSFPPAAPAALSPAPTGGSFNSARSPNVSNAAPTFSPSSGDQGAEYGNKSLQLESTQKAVSDLGTKRSGLESTVAAGTAELAELEKRLTSVRSEHESQSKLVKDLESRQQMQSNELKTLREEVIREESGLSALRAEKDELEQALMRDREDVRDMKKRMNDVQAESKRLKEVLEKLRKDARQQKGLVAISKKQLAASESEQDRIAGEIEAAEKGEAAPQHESRELNALSPAASVRSTNPFDRFGASTPQPNTPGHSSTAPALAAGVGAGAVLGGFAAAGAHHLASSEHESQTDAFGVPAANTAPAQASDGFDDAFAAPAPTQTLDGFDDAFAAPAPGSTSVPATNADFDDSFGDDFGAANIVPEQQSSQTSSALPESTFDDAFGADPDHERATTSAQSGTSTVPTAVGAASGESTQIPVQDEDDLSSDEDEDEGPEDVDGYKPRSASQSEAVATDKFPDIETEEDNAAGHSSMQTPAEETQTVPGGLEDVTSPEPALPIPDAEPSRSEEVEPVSTQQEPTEATQPTDDANDSDFHDAINTSPHANDRDEEVGSSKKEFNETAALATAALATGGGALAAGDGPVEREITSPVDPEDDIPLSQLAVSQSNVVEDAPILLSPPVATGLTDGTGTSGSGRRSISPATRRAPPPAPVRSGTAISTAETPSAATTNPFGMDDFADVPTNDTTTHQSSGAFDDFDSAFEDVSHPPSTTTGAAGHATTTSASGFDDAFDNDFDFDPSFGAPATATDRSATGGSLPSYPATTSAQSGSADASAFDDFDSAFAPAAATTTNAPTLDTSSRTLNGGATSNATPGFSFEDAFDPAQSSRDGTMSPTAPAGTYAPPAGPPPGFTASNNSSAPPVPARSQPSATGDEYTGALPDDAGPVKQLCGMGFTRANVILALEKSNYRTEKALERLLASA